MWSGLVRAGLQIRGRGDRELVSPVNALPGSEEELWMAVPAFLLAMQRPPVLWFVTEIAVSPGNNPLRLHFYSVPKLCCVRKTQCVERLFVLFGLSRKEARVDRGLQNIVSTIFLYFGLFLVDLKQ